jgi:hypothetical protein
MFALTVGAPKSNPTIAFPVVKTAVSETVLNPKKLSFPSRTFDSNIDMDPTPRASVWHPNHDICKNKLMIQCITVEVISLRYYSYMKIGSICMFECGAHDQYVVDSHVHACRPATPYQWVTVRRRESRHRICSGGEDNCHDTHAGPQGGRHSCEHERILQFVALLICKLFREFADESDSRSSCSIIIQNPDRIRREDHANDDGHVRHGSCLRRRICDVGPPTNELRPAGKALLGQGRTQTAWMHGLNCMLSTCNDAVCMTHPRDPLNRHAVGAHRDQDDRRLQPCPTHKPLHAALIECIF